MSKSAAFFIFALIPLYVVAQSPEGSVCLLEDPKNQCGSFCLSVLKPLLDHIAKHQDQWSISDSLGLNETQSKLDRIEGMQLAFEKTVRATMQPTQDMEARLNIMANQQDILISNGNQTLNKLERTISENLGAKLDRMESQQKLWQQELIEKIAEPRQIFEDLKSALETQIKDLQGKLSSLQNSTVSKSIPVNFQKIANRFFYIERLFQKNWFSASDTCRRMGGQLAIIENEEERRAIAAMVNKQANLAFWLDIHNMANKSEYTSSATGTRPPFIKWGKNQPNLFNEDCVALDDGEMHDYNCASKLFFICQA
ncbi:accessory gland protein Acp29AB-like [Drosophila serrata]|uniref:accessory gland protein Acp29AB-like n=1 Tax=Drosophila serrata TaxID=7274 RepID=UPI000A1CFD65|nr:accessory gland protein Acp29AB-like [Drosophila serrata]